MLICILRGGVPFMVDLSRHITVPHMMDFMAVSSYGAGKRESSGYARVTLDLQMDIYGKNVLLVEDIVDSGHTIASVLQMLVTRQPASLKVCALLDKAERREAVVPIHYRGFIIPNKFVFGYGLDLTSIIATCPSLVWWIWRSINRLVDMKDDESLTKDEEKEPILVRLRGRLTWPPIQM